ncbi:hypothetical protein KL86DPRO_30120 [uncultured delta proteobacterium]|uniref:Uncharacterized protein n=1 Tax=uncultured delta proteobacterium TaxID=34034 RepID=A0A212K7V9_9DELT|nr:hypothetical protein KL86DPRO_30120 [uncultured delta proteobacterium]
MTMATMPAGLYRIDPSDNVATALADCAPGPAPLLGAGTGLLELTQPVPRGHKAALAPIGRGQAVVKYGYSIGLALCDIAPGSRVDEANLASAVGLVRGGGAFRPGGKTAYGLPVHPRHNEPGHNEPGHKGGDSRD